MNPNQHNYSVFSDMTTSERTVADFLAENGMWWNYEQPVYVSDDKERPRVWTPDFYLPTLGMYVEVVGDNNAYYGYRENIYRKNCIPIIFVYPNTTGWERKLLTGIVEIHQSRWEILKRLNSL
jgi:hypothetical protein